MAKLLIVDDEKNICGLIQKYAVHEGHECTFAYDGKQAIHLCEKINFDCIIMDIMMPVLNGYQAVEEIRKFSDVPIIMLTAKNQELDKINAFDLGIDDYVVKPFSVKELMKRINAILKRVNKYKENAEIYDSLKLDYLAYKVTIDNIDLDLSPKEIKLLFYLASNKNIACSRDDIIEEVWGYDYQGDDRTLDTHIKLLRKNLGNYGSIIKTIRGVGYRFDVSNIKK